MPDQLNNPTEHDTANPTAVPDAEIAPATKPSATAEKPGAVARKRIMATLVRGKLHVYNNKFFEAGKPLEVTAEEKAHLMVHAVDNMTAGTGDNAEIISRQKFEFAEEEVAAVRTRGR